MPNEQEISFIKILEASRQIQEERDALIRPVIKPESLARDSKDIKSNLEIQLGVDSTYVIALAVNKNAEANSFVRIRCHKGIPIGGYAYDRVNDAYVVKCINYIELGSIAASFKLSFGKYWSINAPVPESVLRRYFSTHQKKELRNFKNMYPDFSFEFIQLINNAEQ